MEDLIYQLVGTYFKLALKTRILSFACVKQRSFSRNSKLYTVNAAIKRKETLGWNIDRHCDTHLSGGSSKTRSLECLSAFFRNLI